MPTPVAPPPVDTRRPVIAANRRRAALVTAVPAAVVAGVLLATIAVGDPILVVVVVAVVVVALAGVAWAVAPHRLESKLRGLGAGRADETAHARLYSVAEGVCLASGVPMPELLVLADEAPNMVSTGRVPSDASLVCTSGLLDLLDRIELEAVVAHEIAHIRGRDTLSGGLAASVLGSIAPRLAARVSGPARETLADQAAVSVTRYPPGLIAALGKLRDAPSVVPARLPRGLVRSTSHLWLVPLLPSELRAREVAGALDLDERIALLVEL
jgi:heat shock protein HtpX